MALAEAANLSVRLLFKFFSGNKYEKIEKLGFIHYFLKEKELFSDPETQISNNMVALIYYTDIYSVRIKLENLVATASKVVGMSRFMVELKVWANIHVLRWSLVKVVIVYCHCIGQP